MVLFAAISQQDVRRSTIGFCLQDSVILLKNAFDALMNTFVREQP